MDGHVRGRRCFFLFFFLVPLFLSPRLSSQALTPNQSDAMARLSRALNRTTWNTSAQDPCHWNGVNCTGGSPSMVANLSLSHLGLSEPGFLVHVCRIDSLRSLNLASNSLASIPGSFIAGCGKLEGLRVLNFSGNELSGAPPVFSGFRALEILDLSHNLLEGSLELGLRDLVSLRSLNASFNRFNGSIPTKLGNPAALRELSLSHNSFRGMIFPGVLVYGNLTLLDLGFNQLSDSDLSSFANLSKLEVLILSSNDLTGELPRSLSTLEKLRWFAANTNNFSGAVPGGITRHLRVLDLSFNRLTGRIPPDLLSSPSLESIDLSSNLIEGPIPGGDMSRRLFRLRLGRNRLKGSIPGRIGDLGNLQYLELDGNSLEGEIPVELGNLANLTLLSLAENQLRGALPREIGNLKKLVVMKLQMNQVNGSIPDEISGLEQLLTLNLSRNSLSGLIPSSISSLTKLSILNLGYNRLSGSIPGSIGDLRSLAELQLGSNDLGGVIPQMPSRLSTALNLSSNKFRGPIPPTLDLPELEILDLSNNEFAGEVPKFFAEMRSLTRLILAHNRLSGVLPGLRPWVTVDIAGNSGLAANGTGSNVIRPRRRASIALVVAVSVAAAVVGSCFAAAVFVCVASRRLYRVEDETPPAGPQTGDGLPQIIEASFLTDDRRHRSAIDFAVAIEEVGNPGNVLRKTRFSTYYKAAMPGGASYCVKKLEWSEKVFQRGNQGRFRQELEDLGRLNNCNVMTPLAYVITADSVHLFYEHLHRGTLFDFLHGGGAALDWPCRYAVALGVAQGLTFLHGCKQPVLLLDLSTKSILLKSLKEPQIADIELSKVTDPSKSTGSISTLAGSVGYIPPEYPYTMRLTTAGNVYSFGVVLLELLTGRPPVSQGTELAKRALSYSSRVREWEQILDTSICRTSPGVRSQMHSVMKVALSCVNQSAEARPKAKNVLRMLFNAR